MLKIATIHYNQCAVVLSHCLSSLMRPLIVLVAISWLNVVFSQSDLRLNERWVIASHNSYKKRPDPKVLRFLDRVKKQLGPENDPTQLDYGHVPLPVQFDSFAVRGIEIDVYNDPKGGHYAKRRINWLIPGLRQRCQSDAMYAPGFKVLHIADVDYETHYLTFRDVLSELKTWSQQHPHHEPIYVNIEPKADGPGTFSKLLRFLGFKSSIPYDSMAFCALDAAIEEILPVEMLFTPSDLQLNYPSIQQRLRTEGWPKIANISGRFIFILDGKGEDYKRFSEHQNLFTFGSPSDEQTAFVIRNEPVGHETEIAELAKTFIVRTRADAGTLESRANDYRRCAAAKRSGAQIISTDYYTPDLRWSEYKVGW